MNQTDLHIHSVYSNDGTYSPDELLHMASSAGILVMAVADHNTVRGSARALHLAWKYQVEVIPAVELDCTFQGLNLHVLGYGIDTTFSGFSALETSLAAQERASSIPRMELLHQMGLEFDEQKAVSLAHYGYITGEIIAEVALQDPRNNSLPLLEAYRPGGKRSDNPYVNFYWDFCAPEKPAYVPIDFISLADAVQLICSSGGIPILAHPGNNVPRCREDLLLQILQQGVCGMEVYTTYHNTEQQQYYRKIAEKLGCLKTIGSDFHGKTKPSIHLGQMDIPEDESTILAQLRHTLHKQDTSVV